MIDVKRYLCEICALASVFCMIFPTSFAESDIGEFQSTDRLYIDGVTASTAQNIIKLQDSNYIPVDNIIKYLDIDLTYENNTSTDGLANIKIMCDNNEYMTTAYIYHSIIYLPIRFLSNFGKNVCYDEKSGSIFINTPISYYELIDCNNFIIKSNELINDIYYYSKNIILYKNSDDCNTIIELCDKFSSMIPNDMTGMYSYQSDFCKYVDEIKIAADNLNKVFSNIGRSQYTVNKENLQKNTVSLFSKYHIFKTNIESYYK